MRRELALSKKVLQFPEVVQDVADTLRPSLLASYLYDLSKMRSTFYDLDTGVRIIDAQPASSRNSRLHLCGPNPAHLALRPGPAWNQRRRRDVTPARRSAFSG
jgi:arginyl-tRNA synthetase